jgi:hypothetical protein
MVLEQSAPRLAKSAERIDGAMIAGGAIVVYGSEFLGGCGQEKLLAMSTQKNRSEYICWDLKL